MIMMTAVRRTPLRGMVTALAVAAMVLVCSALASAGGSSRNPYIDPDGAWEQVSPNIAFQRTRQVQRKDDRNMDGAVNQALRRILSSSSSLPADLAYANGMQLTGEDWRSEQLAWRLLGYYIDCSSSDTCQRMVLYAVYVDPNGGEGHEGEGHEGEGHEGGGLGQYSFYDQKTKKFVCYNSNGCRERMDCHLTDTNWKLLGVFKINDISERDGWMEQLFKHEGICVWGEDKYSFAANMRQHLPEVCAETNAVDPSTGNNLYYDVKPGKNATLTLALYTDNQCSSEYLGGGLDVFKITGASKSDFEKFNKYLDTWKICQPCIAYNLSGSSDHFNCHDDAGYENCNQCMKFSNKSSCEIATARDITLAERQQTLVPFSIYGTVVGTSRTSLMSRLNRVDTATKESFPFFKLCFWFFVVCCASFIGSLGWKMYVTREYELQKVSLLTGSPSSQDKKRRKKKKTVLPTNDGKDGLMVDSNSDLGESPKNSDSPEESGKAPSAEVGWLSAIKKPFARGDKRNSDSSNRTQE